MNLGLRTLTDAEEAWRLLPMLERAVTESSLAWQDTPVPPSVAQRYLETQLDEEGACLVVAESDEETLAVAASAPFVDPLTGAMNPMLVMLWVDPSIRHRGVARALVGELKRRLARRGMTDLAARVGHTDDALTSMGERWGWVRSWSFLSAE